MAAKNWQDEKQRLSKLSQDDRRKNYYCGSSFVPVSEVPTWKKYFFDNQKSLAEKGKTDVSIFQFYSMGNQFSHQMLNLGQLKLVHELGHLTGLAIPDLP